jgi:hypothetical protein
LGLRQSKPDLLQDNHDYGSTGNMVPGIMVSKLGSQFSNSLLIIIPI